MSDRATSSSSIKKDSISFVEIAGVLWRRRWLIGGITGVSAIGILLFSIISLVLPPPRSPLPNKYAPEALLLVAGDTSNGAFGQSSLGNLGELALAADLNGTAISYGSLAIRLMKTRSILDPIIEKYHVASRYNVTNKVQHNSRRMLRERMLLQYEEATKLLVVAYEDTDPEFGTRITNELVRRINERFQTIGGNRSITRRDLLNEKLAEVESRIRELEAEIEQFQQEYNVIDVQQVVSEQTQTLANLRADLIVKQMEIETYSEFARVDDPVLRRLRTERNNLERIIESFEQGSDRAAGGVPSQEELPELAFQYQRLQRNLSIQSQVYQNLASEYELAKLNAEGQEPLLQIIEMAEVPEQKSRPSRSILTIVVTAIAFVIAIVTAFVVDYVEAVRNDPERLKWLYHSRYERDV